MRCIFLIEKIIYIAIMLRIFDPFSTDFQVVCTTTY